MRPSTPPEEASKEMTEAEREKIGSYEEAFEKIKEETGVNSMNVIKFIVIFIYNSKFILN
jgi:hypothetical protein